MKSPGTIMVESQQRERAPETVHRSGLYEHARLEGASQYVQEAAVEPEIINAIETHATKFRHRFDGGIQVIQEVDAGSQVLVVTLKFLNRFAEGRREFWEDLAQLV